MFKISIAELSIIIPTYKRYDELYDCIGSILVQKGDYEIIIISDGFDALTDNIVKKLSIDFPNHSDKIIYLKQRNQGPAVARNKGIVHANGKIITFLDDDCIVCTDWVKNIIEAHKIHPDILAIAGSITPYNSNIISEFSQSLEARASTKNNSYFYPSLINNNSYKKSVFRIVNGFNKSFKFASGEDVEFNYRLHSKGIQTLFINKITVKHNYKTALLPLLKQQFGFGKERLKLMRVANDYPFDKSNSLLYLLKRIITPIADPWLRLICAFKLKKKYSIVYLPLGYLQQLAYWLGFIHTSIMCIFKK